ncbi:MAG TPA: hypothetical protein VLC52_03360, partial [Anaerolineae bacterium]|nr:hypothetical protein [Anaerolineae bacterium]
ERFDLCGGVQEVARTISSLLDGIDDRRLIDYLPRMHNEALAQRLGLVLERLSTVQPVGDELLAGVTRLVGGHVHPLDPHEPDAGELNSQWRIRENIDLLAEL